MGPGGPRSLPSPANKRLCGGRPLLPPAIVSSSSYSSSSSTSTSLLSLSSLLQAFPALQRAILPEDPLPCQVLRGVTWEDDGGGLGVLGRGGVGAWLGGGAERASEVALAAAPTLAKLGLPSPGPAASHSASQHGWRAEQTRPVRAA